VAQGRVLARALMGLFGGEERNKLSD